MLPAWSSATSPTFSVTITATPDLIDPLQITFHARAVTGTPTQFDWSFGDGNYFNSSSVTASSPVHRYAVPGNYTAAVTIFEGNSSASQSIVVDARPAPLVAGIQISNITGALPRTVTFTAVISGGTGTFRSVNWSFGDGGSGVGTSIQYSFVRPGDFPVVLQVIDSSGAAARASAWVNVSAPPATSTPLTSSLTLLETVGVLATILGIALGFYLGRWGRDRGLRLPGGVSRNVPTAPNGAAPVDHGDSLPPAPETTEVGAVTPGRRARAPSTVVPSVGTTLAGTAPPRATPSMREDARVPPPRSARPEVSRSALYLSQRIVLHLAQQGSLGPSEVAPLGFTQHGISRALTVRQNALTNVLRRLVAAGVVTEDVRHVQGQSRRLKVYRLSSRGEALAYDLRAQGLSLDGGRMGATDPAHAAARNPPDPPPAR